MKKYIFFALGLFLMLFPQTMNAQLGTVGQPVNLGVIRNKQLTHTRNLVYDSSYNKQIAHFTFTLETPSIVIVRHRQPMDAKASEIMLDSSVKSTLQNGLAYLLIQLGIGEHCFTSYFQDGSSGLITSTIEVNDIDSSSPALSSNRNYILTRIYHGYNSQYQDQIQYYDGLGRLEQTIQRHTSPSKKDLVTLQEYDEYGRESVAWLPGLSLYNGAYNNPETIKSSAQEVNNDTRPYSNLIYENSSLNRITQQYGPGKIWRDNGRNIKLFYKVNVEEDAQLNCIRYKAEGSNSAPTLRRDGNYATGELYVTIEHDEEWNISYEFKNKLGQIVLVRKINKGENYDTYYIYNEFGNLCFVLPPRIQDEGIEQDHLNKLAYLYRYDNWNRCIGKKIPGTDWIYYVYDKADRLIFTQDGEMRKRGEWLFVIPDVLGRTVLTGVCKNNMVYTGNPLANIVAGVSWTGNNNIYKGYDVTGVSLNGTIKVSVVNYYDRYNFQSLNGFLGLGYETPLSGYGARYSAANNGLLTGSFVAEVNNESSGLYSTFYYDYNGRLIQSKSKNHLGGQDNEFIGYNIIGQPLKRMHIHSVPGKNTLTEVYNYIYDHVGRLIETNHSLNNATPVILARNSYDELGRLKESTASSRSELKTTYTYNVRSWVQNINNYHFWENLAYNFNGNISQQEWRQTGKTRKYSFSYDGLSRLEKAVYSGDGNFGTVYSYDKHGNIKTLERRGYTGTNTFGVIDNLIMSYTGNQLTKVEDTGVIPNLSTSADFRNGSRAAVEYTYDANGNMTKDLNKGIRHIAYNSLNLPSSLTVSNSLGSATNTYVYSAAGSKLSVSKKDSITSSTFKTDYVGNVIYENGVFKRLLVDGGYYQDGMYYFYIRDHLGNNRIVANKDGGVVQSTQYYPFGMAFADGTGQSAQPYKYNGKELDTDRGLNLYDYGARYMDVALGRFTTMDRFAEKYYSLSPYQYAANNPIDNLDINGDSIWFSVTRNSDNVITGITMNVTGKVLNDSNNDVNMKKAVNTVAGAIKSSFRGRIDGVKFSTNIQLSEANSMSDVQDSDHLFVLTDKILSPKGGEITGATNVSGGKVAFIDSDYFVGPYDVTLGKLGEAGRTTAHEFGHMVGLPHKINPFNLMRQGGAFRYVDGKELKNIYENWERGNLNIGVNYELNVFGKRRPNRGNSAASIYINQ